MIEASDTAAPERGGILRTALAGAAHVLAVSEPFAVIYRAAGFDNVVTVANGVSTLPTVVRTPSADGRVRLGYIGGMEPHKGYPLVQAALRGGEYRNLSLLVVDHSKEAGHSHRTTWGTTPVTFVGRMPQSEVSTLYGALDVLLAPSIWPESFGLVTREAVNSGLWVIASDRGAVSECVVDGKNGFVINVDDKNGLAAALARIDADAARYMQAPEYRVDLRKASDQADELARIYIQSTTNGSEPECIRDQTFASRSQLPGPTGQLLLHDPRNAPV